VKNVILVNSLNRRTSNSNDKRNNFWGNCRECTR